MDELWMTTGEANNDGLTRIAQTEGTEDALGGSFKQYELGVATSEQIMLRAGRRYVVVAIAAQLFPAHDAMAATIEALSGVAISQPDGVS